MLAGGAVRCRATRYSRRRRSSSPASSAGFAGSRCSRSMAADRIDRVSPALTAHPPSSSATCSRFHRRCTARPARFQANVHRGRPAVLFTAFTAFQTGRHRDCFHPRRRRPGHRSTATGQAIVIRQPGPAHARPGRPGAVGEELAPGRGHARSAGAPPPPPASRSRRSCCSPKAWPGAPRSTTACRPAQPARLGHRHHRPDHPDGIAAGGGHGLAAGARPRRHVDRAADPVAVRRVDLPAHRPHQHPDRFVHAVYYREPTSSPASCP